MNLRAAMRELALGVALTGLGSGCGAVDAEHGEAIERLGQPLVDETDSNRRRLGTSVSCAIRTRIWACTSSSPRAYQALTCNVDPGFVAVGGGAEVSDLGLLVGSYPSDVINLTGWRAKSKDHGVSSPHTLTVYAIGMQIADVDRATLLANTFVGAATSPPGNLATTSVPLPGPYRLLGGGATSEWTTGPGNLLVSSYSDSFTWVAVSKAHGWDDPVPVTAYVIGIRPTVGAVSVGASSVDGHANFVATGATSAVASLPPGFLPTGAAAIPTMNGPGRLLVALGPNAGSVTQFVARNRDHLWTSSGTMTLRLHGVTDATPSPRRCPTWVN